MRKKLEKEEGDGGEGEAKGAEIKTERSTRVSLGGHGAAFLPRVKGHLSRGIINKLGIDRKRYRDTFTQGSVSQT